MVASGSEPSQVKVRRVNAVTAAAAWDDFGEKLVDE